MNDEDAVVTKNRTAGLAGGTAPGPKFRQGLDRSTTFARTTPTRLDEVERRHAALRQAERAVDHPFDSLASLEVDRAIVDLETFTEGLP